MTTSPNAFLSEVLNSKPIPLGKRAYFQERARNRIYDLVINEFLKSGLTKADVARRLEKRPEQVTRWLGAPGNWTFDTVSDLLLAICASELEFSKSPLRGRARRNFTKPDWVQTDQLQTQSGIKLETRGDATTTPVQFGVGTSATHAEWRSK